MSFVSAILGGFPETPVQLYRVLHEDRERFIALQEVKELEGESLVDGLIKAQGKSPLKGAGKSRKKDDSESDSDASSDSSSSSDDAKHRKRGRSMSREKKEKKRDRHRSRSKERRSRSKDRRTRSKERRRSPSRRRHSRSPPRGTGGRSAARKKVVKASLARLTCRGSGSCGGKGHTYAAAKRCGANPSMICFICSGKGHKMADCPSPWEWAP